MPQAAQARVKAKGAEIHGESRLAPRGFSEEQWRIFERDGILVVPDALRPDEVSMYLGAAQECLKRYPKYSPKNTWKILDMVREHPVRGPLPASYSLMPFSWRPLDLGRVELPLVLQEVGLFCSGLGIYDADFFALLEEDALHANV